MSEPGFVSPSFNQQQEALFAARREIHQELSRIDSIQKASNADALDLIRDMALRSGLSFRLIRDTTGEHLSVYVWDQWGKFGRVEEFDATADMKNPQWLGSVRRTKGAEGIQGTKRW